MASNAALKRQLAQLMRAVGALTEEISSSEAVEVEEKKPEPLVWRVTARGTPSEAKTYDGKKLPYFFSAGWGWPRPTGEEQPGTKPAAATHEVTDTGLADMRQWDGIYLHIETVEPIDPAAAAKAEEEKNLMAAMEAAEKAGMKLVPKDESKQAAAPTKR